MKANLCRLAATVAVMCLAAPGFAQMSTDNPGSTSTGRGTAADGSRPQDGALKGGSIVPGETSGMPDRATSRCSDLTGTLREQCLARERDAAGAGPTRLPEVDAAKSPPAREAPPPQNPGQLRN
jgi:hypothetical protein